MKLGSLFSGGGLGDFGFLAAGMEISWQCEIDPYCQKILALRYPDSKKYTDIKLLKGADLERTDILTGGFPCQPFSVAGKQKGKEDNRYLWPEMLRVIRECRPRWVVGENVPGIINMALDQVCSDLEAEGFEVWPVVFPSHALGAPHKRDRLWIVAHSERNGSHGSTVDRGFGKAIPEEPFWSDDPLDFEGTSCIPATEGTLANTTGQRCESWTYNSGADGKEVGRTEPDIMRLKRSWASWWKSEPSVGRVANGIASRVDRLKCLGNGQTPACTYTIGRMIMEIENDSSI